MIRRSLVFTVLFSMNAALLLAQRSTLVLHSMSADSFPTITAMVYRFDATTGAALPIDRASLSVTEDGVRRNILALRCPDGPQHTDVSSVLTIDVSGSMAKGGPNITLARAAAQAWIDALTPGSDCAITSFDHRHYVNIDLTTDKQRLREVLPSLTPRGGTNYNEGFVGDPYGGLRIAATGTKKRVLIFLTDGMGVVTPEQVIREAERDSVTIYCVSLGMIMPTVLRDIAERTGGMYFENVTTVEEAVRAYRRIFDIVTGSGPCMITWESTTTCSPIRSVNIAVGADSLFTKYDAPDSAVTKLEMNPPTLTFGVVPNGTTLGREITFTARNGDFTIRNVTRHGDERFKLVDVTTPITIRKDRSVTWRVEFTASDTTYATARWDVETDICLGTTIYAVAGSNIQAPRKPTLHVVYPNGGERLIAGTTTMLRYDGIPPDQVVKLDVSTDGGVSWQMAAFDVKNFGTPWRVPYVKSNTCLLRVSQDQPTPQHRTNGAVIEIEQDRIRSIRYSPNGRLLLATGWNDRTTTEPVTGPARLYDATNGTLLRTLDGADQAIFAPDGSSVITCGNGILKKWDVATGNVVWERPLLIPGVVPKNLEISKNAQRLLVAGGMSDTTWIVDMAGGTVMGRLPRADKNILWATISSDGKLAAICDADSAVHIYDASNMRRLHSIRERGVRVFYRAAFHPTDPLIAVTTSTGVTSLWSTVQGTKIRDVASRQYINDNTYIAFSPDGLRMTVETGKDQTKIFDTRSGSELVTMNREPDAGGVSDVVYSADGAFIAMNTLSKTTIYQADRGIPVASFPRIEGLPSFSPDHSMVAVVSAPSVASVFPLLGRVFMRDESDALWSIIKPEPNVADVRFAPRIIGSAKDSVVTAAVKNIGEAPFTIQNMRIEGSLTSEFSVLSYPQRTLQPGESVDVEYSFQPQSEGERAAAIVLETDIGIKRARITGRALPPLLSLNVRNVDFGAVNAGRSRTFSPSRFLRNSSSRPITVTGMRITGPNAAAFAIAMPEPFVLAPNEWREIPMTFTPTVEGRTSTLAEVSIKELEEPLQFTMTGKGGEDVYTLVDPTTFRSIMLPTAVIPKVGTLTTGVYDVVGLSAGYVVHENVMITTGGALPLPNRWFGATGYSASLSYAYSLGIKTGFAINDKVIVGGGYQIGQSTYDQEYSEPIESRITFNALWATAGYGTDDSRLNVYLGYAFKHHVTAFEGEFQADATIVGLAYDRRISEHWKICGEAFFMRTMTFVPVTFTARYFTTNYALEAGFSVVGIPASGAAAASFPIVPMLTWVQRW